MSEPNPRITDPGDSPTPSAIASWVGKDAYEFWKRVTQLIEQNYPDIFTPRMAVWGEEIWVSIEIQKGEIVLYPNP